MLFAGFGFQIVYVLTAVLFSLTIHEASHALVATLLGDPSSKNAGRLSLNPFAHLNRYSILLMLLIGFSVAKPVRIDATKLKPGPKIGMALVAIAGPISNIILALIFAVPLRFHMVSLVDNIRIPLDILPIGLSAIYVGLGSLVLWLEWLNIALATFNLIPIPPLDGSRIWQMFLPDRFYYKLVSYEIIGIPVLLGLIISDQLFGTRLFASTLGMPLSFIWRLFVGMTPPFQF
jgi:Zn-dependent protease